MHQPKWLVMAEGLLPQVLLFTPLAPIAGLVAKGIQEAQLIAGKSGAEKLAHVTAIARDGIAAVNAQAGETKIDPQLADSVIQKSISTAVDVVKIVHDAHSAD